MYTVYFDTVQGLRLSGLCLAAQRDGFSYTRWAENQGESSKWGGGGHSCCVWKEENFLHRGSQIVLGGRYRKVGMRVMLREAIRARRKCAGMLCGLEGHHSGDFS